MIAGKTTARLLSIILLSAIFSGQVFAQPDGNKDALKGQYDQLLKEIRQTEVILEQTKRNKEATVGELTALQRKIDIRKKLIGNISLQINGIDNNINETTRIIISMERDLSDLKDEYADMVYYAYINQDVYDRIGFVFSSESVTEAFRKIQYIKSYTAFRKEQLELIRETQQALAFKVDDLEVNKAQKRSLLQVEQSQRQILDSEKSEQSTKIQKLSSIEGKLRTALETKKKDAEALNKKIEAIIAEEIRKERLRALEAANRSGNNTGSAGAEVPTLTPEMRLLSSSFESNKGRLPWPVERGAITGKFGKRLHPVLQDPPVYVQSNGLDISTTPNSDVRSIFDGEVVNIIFNPTFQKGVIIKHGEYFSVYTKLRDVTVKPGDQVKAKQSIGKVYSDEEENKTEVHLEIWKGTTLMNPQVWISRN